MKEIFSEIDDFFDNSTTSDKLSFTELKALMHPMRQSVDHFFGKMSFENQRTAILIYLAENYLSVKYRDQWYKYYQIHLVNKTWTSAGRSKKSLLVSNKEVPEPDGSEDDSICTDISDKLTGSDDESDSDLLDIEETCDNIPEKIIEVAVPEHRHDNNKKICMMFDTDYDFYQSIHRLDRDLIKEIYEKNLSSDLIHDLGYSAEYIQERFNFWRNIPQAPQKSKEWLEQRTNCITASALADSLGHKGKQARQNLLLNKVSRGQYKPFSGNFYTRWGEKYEGVAAAIYCYRYGVSVFDFGLLPHSKHPILGASTDGVTNRLINLEIKCPPSREITGIIPKHYWEQIQLQLEVLNLPLSHFLECRIEEFDSSVDFYASFKRNWEPKGLQERGIIIEIINTGRENVVSHRHSPIELHDQPDRLSEWHREQVRNILASPDLVIGVVSYWYLDRYSCINVQRDFKWFQENLDKIFQFWSEVEKYREMGFEALLERIEKERFPASVPLNTDEVCLLDDSSGEEKDRAQMRPRAPQGASRRDSQRASAPISSGPKVRKPVQKLVQKAPTRKPNGKQTKRTTEVVYFDLV